MSNYPPGVTGTEPQIAGTVRAAIDVVFDYLNQQRQGASESVIARATGLTEYDVRLSLDVLVASGEVRVVRRTKTSTLFGVVPS